MINSNEFFLNYRNKPLGDIFTIKIVSTNLTLKIMMIVFGPEKENKKKNETEVLAKRNKLKSEVL